MRLIIVSGAPATGKTGIATKLADGLGCTLYSKDALKEDFFDSYTGKSHGYFWYEERAKEIFFNKIQEDLARGALVVAENNFMVTDRQRLRSIVPQGTEAKEIYCSVRGLTRLKRFIKRAENEPRHKAHPDRMWYLTTAIESLLSYIGVDWPYGPVGVSDKILKVDTTDFSKVSFEKIKKFAKS